MGWAGFASPTKKSSRYNFGCIQNQAPSFQSLQGKAYASPGAAKGFGVAVLALLGLHILKWRHFLFAGLLSAGKFFKGMMLCTRKRLLS
jgi:hypothetical protein